MAVFSILLPFHLLLLALPRVLLPLLLQSSYAILQLFLLPLLPFHLQLLLLLNPPLLFDHFLYLLVLPIRPFLYHLLLLLQQLYPVLDQRHFIRCLLLRCDLGEHFLAFWDHELLVVQRAWEVLSIVPLGGAEIGLVWYKLV